MTSAPVVIRGLTEDDWEVLRSTRLMALEDAPSAFGTSLAEAAGWGEQRWRERARGSERSRLFLADRATHPVGMAGVFEEDDGSAQVISVWVRPEQRRQGVARALIAAAVQFAQTAGLSPVFIWVVDDNIAARRLYESMGFRVTGRGKPVGPHTSVQEHELEWMPRV